MKARTNAEWLIALKGEGEPQTAALSDLRAYLLRAARHALHGNRTAVRLLAPADFEHLAQDAAQDALSALLAHLHDFRGESRFTTWAYNFAIHAAFVNARRERWGRIPLDRLLDNPDLVTRIRNATSSPSDPERKALQGEMLDALRQAIAGELTERQRQALNAIVFDGVPLDELARRWRTNRNALYKLLHDARRKLKDAFARARLRRPRDARDVR
jgi:RNA polymerase sigma-70 factor, ECF subfamily